MLSEEIAGRKGLVYDFDGVLGDTEELQMEKWNILLKRFGIEISMQEYIGEYCGKSSATEIPLLLKERYKDRIPLSAEELGKQAGIILSQLFATRKIKLMPEAEMSLRLFYGFFRVAVCSANDPQELQMKLERAGLNRYFPKDWRSTQSEAGGFAKPHPAMYLLAVERLRLKPEECIAFEDTLAGVQSAKSAGLFVVAMPNAYSQGQDFSAADVVVKGGWPAILAEFSSVRGI